MQTSKNGFQHAWNTRNVRLFFAMTDCHTYKGHFCKLHFQDNPGESGLELSEHLKRGAQFQSSLFQEFTNLLGVKHIRTTAYHLCTNGLVESFHQSLKTSLATRPTSDSPRMEEHNKRGLRVFTRRTSFWYTSFTARWILFNLAIDQLPLPITLLPGNRSALLTKPAPLLAVHTCT